MPFHCARFSQKRHRLLCKFPAFTPDKANRAKSWKLFLAVERKEERLNRAVSLSIGGRIVTQLTQIKNRIYLDKTDSRYQKIRSIYRPFQFPTKKSHLMFSMAQ